MLTEVCEALALQKGDVFVDCTLGGAGHSGELIKYLIPDGTLIGIDQDDMALNAARERLNGCDGLDQSKIIVLQGNFGDLDELLLAQDMPGVNAILFDLGVSSPQIDIPARGFSYSTVEESLLDMRMNPGTQTQTAAELINTTNEAELARIIRDFGEERWAKRIAEFIVKERMQKPIRTSSELVQLVYAAIPAGARKDGGNPAKRTFQALRIAVNDELGALRRGLDAALRWLLPGGRVVVISYHSLEDRIVKQLFLGLAKKCFCPEGQPVCTCGTKPVLSEVGKLQRPSEAEIKGNSRARSARLRWAKKA
jgi:16S rRNA (cytosine1402-N4)-methyltransferase